LNKFFRLIGFSLLFMMLFLIILGIYSSPDIQITQTHQLQAPTASIWQHITDDQKNCDWINQIPIQYCESDSNGIIVCYMENSSKNIISTILKDEENRSLKLKLDKTWDNPYIVDYTMNVHLKTLRDGTTEINCTVQYHLNNIIAKVANKLYFEGQQKNLLNQNLQSIYKYFEKV
jgi:hypothetical protein